MSWAYQPVAVTVVTGGGPTFNAAFCGATHVAGLMGQIALAVVCIGMFL